MAVTYDSIAWGADTIARDLKGTHPITLERKGAHAIGRSMGWTESWTLSDN